MRQKKENSRIPLRDRLTYEDKSIIMTSGMTILGGLGYAVFEKLQAPPELSVSSAGMALVGILGVVISTSIKLFGTKNNENL